MSPRVGEWDQPVGLPNSPFTTVPIVVAPVTPFPKFAEKGVHTPFSFTSKRLGCSSLIYLFVATFFHAPSPHPPTMIRVLTHITILPSSFCFFLESTYRKTFSDREVYPTNSITRKFKLLNLFFRPPPNFFPRNTDRGLSVPFCSVFTLLPFSLTSFLAGLLPVS